MVRHPRPPIPFPEWQRAQREVDRLAPSCRRRRRSRGRPASCGPRWPSGYSRWFLAPPAAPSDTVRRSYRALERDTARLYRVVCREARGPGASCAFRGRPVRQRRGALRRAARARDDDAPDDRVRPAASAARRCGGRRRRPAAGRPRRVRARRARTGVRPPVEVATWLQCRALFSGRCSPCRVLRARRRRDGLRRDRGEAPLQAKLPLAALLSADAATRDRHHPRGHRGLVTRDLMRDLPGRDQAGSGAGSTHDLHRAAHHSGRPGRPSRGRRASGPRRGARRTRCHCSA